MALSKTQARALLKSGGLRATAPRLAVLRVLAEQAGPISHTEVLNELGATDWDPATIYRNLVKLTEAGVATVVSRADGKARYALAGGDDADAHQHAHFVCTECSRVSCLPDELFVELDKLELGHWSRSLSAASVQFRGPCPDCFA